MENLTPEVNPIKKDLRRLLGVLVGIAIVMSFVQYLAIKTSKISDISHNIYKATLENS
ncbi:MAG: hypothetical protein AAB445_04495 [Patescibacteria group bacterium]